jgi:hypothetical protein
MKISIKSRQLELTSRGSAAERKAVQANAGVLTHAHAARSQITSCIIHQHHHRHCGRSPQCLRNPATTRRRSHMTVKFFKGSFALRHSSGSLSLGRAAHLSLSCDVRITSEMMAVLGNISQMVAADEEPRFASTENVHSLCQDALQTRAVVFRNLLTGHIDESQGRAR